MLEKIKDGIEEFCWELSAGLRDTKKEIIESRKQAAYNRGFLPSHAIYKRQYKRDLLYGLSALGISLPALIYSGILEKNWEKISQERADKACAEIICEEDFPRAIAPYINLGITDIDVEEYLKMYPHPKKAEVKESYDNYNRLNDFAPIVGFGAFGLIGTSFSIGNLIYTIRRDKQRKKNL